MQRSASAFEKATYQYDISNDHSPKFYHTAKETKRVSAANEYRQTDFTKNRTCHLAKNDSYSTSSPFSPSPKNLLVSGNIFLAIQPLLLYGMRTNNLKIHSIMQEVVL